MHHMHAHEQRSGAIPCTFSNLVILLIQTFFRTPAVENQPGVGPSSLTWGIGEDLYCSINGVFWSGSVSMRLWLSTNAAYGPSTPHMLWLRTAAVQQRASRKSQSQSHCSL